MDQYTFFIFLAPSGITIALLVCIYCWRHRNLSAARQLAITMGAAAAYLLFNILELVSPTPQATLFFASLCYPCIGVLVIHWLKFAMAFASLEDRFASRRFRLIWVVPAVTTVLIFTNSFHHLIWYQYTFIPVSHGFLYLKVLIYGSYFWVAWLFSYLLILSGTVLMMWASLTCRRRYRAQFFALEMAALLPLVVNLIYVFHLIPGLQKDYSPLAYTYSGILLAISIFRYRMLDLMPFARAVLIERMNDGMLTLDHTGQVVDINPAAVRILAAVQAPAPQIGDRCAVFDEQIQKFHPGASNDLIKSELELPQTGEEGFYDVQIRRLRDQQTGEVVGYLILMHAVTDHKKLLQAVRKMAEEDVLTGVFNRAHFIELTRRQLEHSSANLSHYALLMIDMDNFKQVNDTFGHVGGDHVLQAFAQYLHSLLRASDLLGRIGGDEFIVLLPDTPLNDALTLANRLCQQVAATPIQAGEFGAFHITISIGVAECTQGCDNNLEPVIAEADRGLYQAKALGRNRACIYNPAIPAP